MTAAQFELIDESEAEAILRWRFEELVRAGYDIGSALVLASQSRSISTTPRHSAAAVVPQTPPRILL